jgi:anti-sigma regulatory factor (Ser/Thr protein kinase)
MRSSTRGQGPVCRTDAGRRDRLPRAKEVSSARAPPEGRLEHDAFVYNSAEELLSAAVPFVREGLAANEPVLAAPTSANADLLRKELGVLADAVDWARQPERHKPVERLAVFVRYSQGMLARGARRIRLLSEPVCLDSPSAPVTTEWKRYESYLNVALAPYSIWLLCPYPATELPAGVVADAPRMHPTLRCKERRVESAEYVEPEVFARNLDRMPLSAPSEGTEVVFHAPSEVRRFVAQRGKGVGLGPEAVDQLRLATGEVAANVFRHGDGVPRVKTWIDAGSFVCEVRDEGPGIDDPFAGYEIPDGRRLGGWGLSIVRQLCDAVEIRSDAAGTRVRLQVKLG